MIFKGIKRFWRIICFFMRAKKNWSRPRQSDALIYDATRQDSLLKYLSPWHPELLHLRGEQINMRVLFSSLFRSGAGLDSYVDCFIEKVQPRLVVTFIDNSVHFYTISKKYPEVKTLFIQNGLRTFDLYRNLRRYRGMRSKFFVDYMLVFGECVGVEYLKLLQGESVIMGSIDNNLARKERETQSGVIAFLSQWNPNGLYLQNKFYSQEELMSADRLVLEFLVRYAEAKNKRLMMIPRYRKDRELLMSDEQEIEMEKAYLRDLLGSEPEYLEPEGPYPGYQAVDLAEITVTTGSTLGYESIARGNKVAIFSIRWTLAGLPAGVGNFGWPGDFPDEGLFWTNKPDSDGFERILDYLFEVDDVQWLEDVRGSNFSSIMTYDPGNSVLAGTLERVLGATPSP
jgi:surface carbohydrate biosynthesis protein